VEFFFAKPGTQAIRQFFLQPDIGSRSAAVYGVKGMGKHEACSQFTTSVSETESGYQLMAIVPREAVGISPDERECLIEIQVSRIFKGHLEHVALFGGPGAYASSDLYVRVIEERPGPPESADLSATPAITT
jgi:hypothetical protein